MPLENVNEPIEEEPSQKKKKSNPVLEILIENQAQRSTFEEKRDRQFNRAMDQQRELERKKNATFEKMMQKLIDK